MGPTRSAISETKIEGRRLRELSRRRWRYGSYRSFRFDFEDDDEVGYWSGARLPLPNLVFTLPFVLAYEVGLACFAESGSTGIARTGVDLWVRQGLAAVGLPVDYVLPSGLILLLVVWMLAAGPRTWQLRGSWLVAMIAESLLFGFGIIGLSRLADQAILWLDQGPLPLTSNALPSHLQVLIGAKLSYVGAGVYEEAVFRLVLLPVLYRLLRIVQTPELLAGTLAVSGSALAFALGHHAGITGEPFTWYAFGFRWLAGVVFAWIFIVRGFGIAMGAHVAYDLLASSFDWTG